MVAFARTRETPDWAKTGTLLEGGFDFGFGISQIWENPESLLPSGAQAILEAWRNQPSVPVVISEIPTEWPEWSLEPILETRPGEIPDPYPGTEAAATVDPSAIIGPYQGADTSEQQEGGEVVAHDWGHLARQFIGGVMNGGDAPMDPFGAPLPPTMPGGSLNPVLPTAGAGGDCDGMAWSGGTPPKGYKVVNYCGRGVLRKVRRRRRRRLLTASDSRDIATIVGLVGKGQMASALINRR